MITFSVSLIALIIGYIVYGRFVEKVFGPDNRETPAVSKADGIDYIALPSWKVFMIQFLNIAGTGPIFGAIMGAKFGPVAYLWIVFGCIFAGAVHDYLVGMLSMRNGGASCPEIVGKYLGEGARKVMLVFAVFLLLMVGTVFVFSPASIMQIYGGTTLMWVIIIFLYYILATMLPIDKIIGRFYPIFAFSLLFMAAGLMGCLFIKWPQLPELWSHVENMGMAADASFTDQIFPCLFITIACGALSGFHATQSPLMARCLKSEKMGRPVFYGSMITEGVVALVWATVSMYFFYGEPAPGYELINAVGNNGMSTQAPELVKIMCNDWLGIVGGILAVLGVVAAPVTSGDTAFRSARLIIAEAFHISQKPIAKRLMVCLPLFAASLCLLIWQIEDKNGFNTIWQYFGWSNQTLSVIMLWAATVYLVRKKKPFLITLIPALFMTAVCVTFLFISKLAFHLPEPIAYSAGAILTVAALVWFVIWYRKEKKNLI
jgi:carbon starvation protein CstA